MKDRLSKLFFVAPPSDTPWSGPPAEWRHHPISRTDGQKVEISSPLFWYDPPWHQLPTEKADQLAIAVGSAGVLVSALARDLGGQDGLPEFFCDFGDDPDSDEPESAPLNRQPLPRIVPYRPERYGIADEDFDGPVVIDVRLTMNRDVSGRFAYSADQIERWEATPSGEPVSGGSWVPSATFPPDVVSIDHLGCKFDQLRVLSPGAAVFVSIDPFRIRSELPAVVNCKPDGVILRLDTINADGLEMASLTKRTRSALDHAGEKSMPLWIVPGPISPDDAAKLVALGASAVAVDSWCERIFEELASEEELAAARLGYSALRSGRTSHFSRVVDETVAPMISRVAGLLSSSQAVQPEQRLSSLDEEYLRVLDLHTRILPQSDGS